MRVLLVSWEYPPVIEGGLGRHVRKLSEQLVTDGLEVHVLTRGAGRLPAEDLRRGVHLHRVIAPPFPRDMEKFLSWVAGMNRDLSALGSALTARLPFDLVHSHDWLVSDAAEQIAVEHDLPWLVTIHATEYGRHQGRVKQHPQSFIHKIERRMAQRAGHVIVCSDYMAAHVANDLRVGAGRISSIPNGIDPAEMISAPADELAALRARFAAPDERLVLMVGRLVYEKGFHLALDALAPIARRDGRLRFIVAGSGGAEAELKAQARKLGISHLGSFSGWVGDDALQSLYRVADVCIVPSIYEPFGLVALEAMACGCVCVVADTGGLREVVPDDGSAGRRFASDDAEALGETLEQLLGDDAARERIAERAGAHALRFDWSEVAARTSLVYEQLRAKRGARSSIL